MQEINDEASGNALLHMLSGLDVPLRMLLGESERLISAEDGNAWDDYIQGINQKMAEFRCRRHRDLIACIVRSRRKRGQRGSYMMRGLKYHF